jgi:hypothetical protein
MEKSVLGLIVGVVILLGTVSTVALFMAGRTPPGAPVVPSSMATLASDQVAVARADFEGAIISAAAGDRTVRARTRIVAGYRLVDIGLARIAVRAPVDAVVAWDRLRRSGEAVDVALPLGPTAGLVPLGRDGPGPLDLWLRPDRAADAPASGWVATVGPVTVRVVGERVLVDGAVIPVDLPVVGPGRWIVFFDAEGSLQRIERGTAE